MSMGKGFNFTYIFCTNLEAMRNFYTQILKLNEKWYEESNSLAYLNGGHQLSITQDIHLEIPDKSFSIQPGWEGGTNHRVSWSLECDEGDFNDIIKVVTESNIVKYNEKPIWKGYWSFPILDPMNNTIEITCTKKEIKIDQNAWI
jgi:catechol 2,3-dioxygenase-like lactoylglutathione lyase family enzyme